MVEPVDVLDGGELHVVEPGSGAAFPDQLGLVEAVERLGQGVVVGVAPGSHRGHRAGVGEALGVADRQLLPPRSEWWTRAPSSSPRRAQMAMAALEMALVGAPRLELGTSCSQSKRATGCATPR